MMTRRTIMTAASAALASVTAARASPASGAAASDLLQPGREDIAMLLYPGMTALDFVGPHHFLGMMPGARMHLVTTQADLRPVPSDLGMGIQPTTTMADCPGDLAVLFAPGGIGGTLAAARDRRVLEFMRERGERARYVTSVCTGSLILGAAGLLRGRRATSHFSVVPQLAQFGAIPDRRRVVRDGKVITGAGVSAGLDFGATLVAELRGAPLAEFEVLMSEYAPEPPFQGGRPETARPEIARLVDEVLVGLVEGTRSLQVLP
jgi:putative intracellular protease/amidase